MKTLFITYHYLAGHGGGVFASRAYINAFAELSEEITLLCPIKDNHAPEGLNHKVHIVPVKNDRKRVRKGFDLLTGRSNRFVPYARLADNQRFDTVVFDTSMVTHGLIRHFKEQGIKVITIHHNYQFEYYQDNSSILTRLPTLFWSRRTEREAVRESDLNLTLTEADKVSLTRHYGTGKERLEVIGTFEYNRRKHPLYSPVNEQNFLITGNLSDAQTENSLLPWIKDYYPILKEIFPLASLTIAGKSPSTLLLNAARSSGITVIPSPESMDPILAKAKFFICPTALGGGLKLRVMDGLSHGLPVICHSVSARGYEAFIKAGMVLVYSDPDSFHQELRKLKSHDYDRNAVISLYESIFSFDSGKQRLSRILDC